MIEVELEDRIVEFPDDTTEEQITAALKGVGLIEPRTKQGETKADLQRKMTEARIAGEQGKASEALLGAAERAAYTLAHMDVATGLGRKQLEAQGVPTMGPVIPPEMLKADIDTLAKFGAEGLHLPPGFIPHGISEGAKETAAEMGSMMTEPEMAGALVAGKVDPRLIGRIFQGSMALGVPQSVQAVQQAETPKELTKAALGLGANVLFPAAIELGIQRQQRAVPIPDYPGRAIPVQRGALPPRPEPEPPLELLTPEQARIAAERMQREAEASFEAEPKPPPVESGKAEPVVPVEAVSPRIEAQPAVAAAGERPAISETKPTAEKAQALEKGPHETQGQEKGLPEVAKVVPVGSREWRIANAVPEDWTVKETGGGSWVAESPITQTKGQWGKLVKSANAAGKVETYGVRTEPPRTITPPTPAPVAAPAKQPWEKSLWELTRKELDENRELLRPNLGVVSDTMHRDAVAQALREGKPVPAEVLADYPDLAKPTPAPAKPAVEGKGVRRFEVDEQLVMRSPHTGEDTVVSFRGLMPDGKAVVWTGKSQFPVPVEWLRKQGEKYERPMEATSKNENLVQVQKALEDASPVGKADPPAISKLSKEELVDLYRKEVPLAGTTLRSALLKKSAKSLRQDIETARSNRRREAQELDLARQVEPEIKAIADNAGGAWRTALNKYAADQGWSFHPPPETTKGEYVAMLALERARKQLKQPTPPPATGEGSAAIGQGPGARTAEARVEAPESYSGTALKNAVAELERAAFGFPIADKTQVKPMAEAWIRAGKTLERTPLAGERLVSELRDNPLKGLNDEESALLLRHKTGLINEMNEAAELSIRSQDPQVKASAQAKYDAASEQLLTILNVAKARGTEWGRVGRWRQVMAQEDYTLAHLVTDRRARLGGRELTEAETAELRAIEDQHKALAEQNAKRVAELESELAQRILEQSQQQAKVAPAVLEFAERFVSRMETVSDRYSKELFESTWSPTPDVLAKAAFIGATRMARGTLELAKWTDEMVKSIGEKFRPYAEQVYEMSKARLNEEIAKAESVPNAPKFRQALPENPKEFADGVVQRIKEKQQTKKGADLEYYANRLAVVFVKNGIRERNALIDAVHGVLQEAIPGITRRQTMDAISGYGKYTPLDRKEFKVVLRDLRGQMQQVGKLEDMAAKQAPRKTGPERRTPTDEERRLIKQVEEAKRRGGYEVTDPERQLRTAMQAAQTRLQNQISDLEHQINTRTKIVKEKRSLQYDEKTKQLQTRRDELKTLFDEVFPKPELTEAQRLALWKKNINRRITEYEDRIKSGQFRPKTREETVRLDPEAIKLRYELHKVHNALMDLRLKDQLSQRNTARKVIDGVANTIRFSRAAMTGGEFSAVLRQGGILGASHPVVAAKSLSPMFKALLSEEAQFKINEEIQTRPNAPLYQKAKLEFTESGVRLSTMEEHYMFRVSERLSKIWGVKHTVKFLEAFQRAYTTYLNRLRADVFDVMAETYGKDPQTLSDIANYINVTTGRGSTGLGRYVGPGANAVFFAPRYAISRFQYLAGQPYWRASKQSRNMILKEYGRTLAGAAAVFTLGALAGGEIENDPRSPDFGKIKFGNTRVDPLAGLAQATRLLATEATGWKKTAKGRMAPIRETYRLFPAEDRPRMKITDESGAEVAGRFLRYKLSPSVGAGVSLVAGKNPVGQPFKLSDVLVQSFTPITYGDVLKAMQEQGVDKGTAMAVLAIFGMGVQTYDPRKEAQNQ